MLQDRFAVSSAPAVIGVWVAAKRVVSDDRPESTYILVIRTLYNTIIFIPQIISIRMGFGASQSADPAASSDTLERTEIHDVLRNDRRRVVLSHLQDTDTPVSVGELSEHVAAVETGKSPAPRDVRQSVYVSLHQNHLPKLSDLGIIESHGEGVMLADQASEVTVYLEIVPQYDLSWGEYYLGLAALGLLCQLALAIDVPVIGAVTGSTMTTIFFFAFALSAVYQISLQEHTLVSRLRK